MKLSRDILDQLKADLAQAHITMTRSQQMALCDLIIENISNTNAVHEFIDFSHHPPVTTTDAELLEIVGRLQSAASTSRPN